MEQVSLAQHASRRGFPATLFGLTPDELAYWWEPGLPWALDGAEDQPLLDFMFADEEMAPRFSAGLTVGLALVTEVQELHLGQVYVHLPLAGNKEVQAGRLARITKKHLELTQDNSTARLRWPLPHRDYVYQVTHYVDCPSGQRLAGITLGKPGYPVAPTQRASELSCPLDPKQAYLLQLRTNQMGPRYPTGARYVIHYVPADRWGQATGVHALQLHGGQQLLARCIGPNLNALAYVLDATGQIGIVNLADIACLWKLGIATYLPEETEAEHQAVVQRPID